uniref:Uncharacterized protein n=1 Tax=Cebus imitator TaxID=2715852 RepID=A0A2K5QGS3_CEBIM
MLRGKSRLNVEWLGYSPGLLLEHRPLLAGRTPRSHRRNESSLASTLKTLLFFTALMITVPIGLYFTTKSYIFEGNLRHIKTDIFPRFKILCFYDLFIFVNWVFLLLLLFFLLFRK